jgi:hypothetical protein
MQTSFDFPDRIRGDLDSRSSSFAKGNLVLRSARVLIRKANPRAALQVLRAEELAQAGEPWLPHAHLLRSHAFSQIGDELNSDLERHRVTPDELKSRPELAAQFRRLEGDEGRRKARREWKDVAAPATAAALAEHAVDSFSQAYEQSVAANNVRMASRLRLSTIYTKGLIASIRGKSNEANLALAIEAVQTTADMIALTPRGEQRPLYGLTMLADLCRAIKLEPAHLRGLVGTESHRAACDAVLGATPASCWAAQLQREVDRYLNPDLLEYSLSVARALVLAATVVDPANTALAFRIQQALMILLAEHRAYGFAQAKSGVAVIPLPGLAAAQARLANQTGVANSIRLLR